MVIKASFEVVKMILVIKIGDVLDFLGVPRFFKQGFVKENLYTTMEGDPIIIWDLMHVLSSSQFNKVPLKSIWKSCFDWGSHWFLSCFLNEGFVYEGICIR